MFWGYWILVKFSQFFLIFSRRYSEQKLNPLIKQALGQFPRSVLADDTLTCYHHLEYGKHLLKWGHKNSGASYEISSLNSFLADAENYFRSGRILTFHSTQIIKDIFLNALLRWLGCDNKAVLPRFNTNFIKHSIAYRGSVIWNALSQRLNVKTSNFKNGPVTRWWKHIKK